MKQARVLFLVTDAFGGYGGIALYNRDFLEAICTHPRCGEVVTVPRLVHSDPGTLPSKITHVLEGLGGNIPYARAVLALLTRDRRFDLIICAHVHLLPHAYLASMLTGAPIVLLMYGIEVWKPPRIPLIRWMLGKVLAYASISKVTESRFLSWAGKIKARSFILPNAIRLELYEAGARDEALAARYGVAGKRVLMTLGRLADARYKGFDEVIEILPDMVKADPDLAYMVVGKGEDMTRLKAKAEALGISSHVVFTGFVEEEHKAALYRLADVYVMASRGEGFGFVILEALASGIPTIASSVDGGREALRDGMLGQLVDPAKPEELKAAISRALKTPKHVPEGLSYFAFPNFERRLHDMFDQWLDSRGQRGSR